jgi:hypothetical protein
VAVAPGGQFLGHCHVADELASSFIVGLLHCQCLVEHEAAGTSETRHLARLLTVWAQFVFEGLEALHTDSIYSLVYD